MALTALDLNADLDTSTAAAAAIPILEAYCEYARALFEKRRFEEAGITVPSELALRISDLMAAGKLPEAYRGTNINTSPSLSPSISPSKSPSLSPSLSPSISPSPSS